MNLSNEEIVNLYRKKLQYQREKAKQWANDNKDRYNELMRAASKRYYEKNREVMLQKMKARKTRIKNEAILAMKQLEIQNQNIECG